MEDDEEEWEENLELSKKRNLDSVANDESSSGTLDEDDDWAVDSDDDSNDVLPKKKRSRGKNSITQNKKKVQKNTNTSKNSSEESLLTPETLIPGAPTVTPSSSKCFSNSSNPLTPKALNLQLNDSNKKSNQKISYINDNNLDDGGKEYVNNAGSAGDGVVGAGSHEHNFWDFLNKNRRDKNSWLPDHPDYNPRTLYVPPSFLRDQTPAMKQWWDFKCENMDTVLFFKVSFLNMHFMASIHFYNYFCFVLCIINLLHVLSNLIS